MKEYTVDKIKSKNANGERSYLLVDFLPTRFRSYGDIKSVHVRGLFFDESLAISKFASDVNLQDRKGYAQLASIYSDAISGIDVKELEVVDFAFLMTLSSIWTVNKFEWRTDLACTHDGCTGVITDPLRLSEFDFKEPTISLSRIPYTFLDSDIEYFIGPVYVKDLFDANELVERYKATNRYTDNTEAIVKYAVALKGTSDNPNMSLEDRYNIIKNCYASDLECINTIISDLEVSIDPVEKVCPKCGKTTLIAISLNKLRSYPKL